jgi:NADH-quinone oxidoreductase subunit B
LGLSEAERGNILTVSYDKIFNWARRSAIWPMQFGLACCAIEMMAVLDPTVTEKMAPIVRRLWDQMPEPKWALAMGACATCGGPYRTYAVTQGVDRIIPVDVYVPGCPPRPEALLWGLLHLQRKIDRMSSTKSGKRGQAAAL